MGFNKKKGQKKRAGEGESNAAYAFLIRSLQGGILLVIRSINEDLIKELKIQWKTLWQERIDDKVRAEGIANRDYSMLFVEKGLVIFATKDFKALDFREILTCHKLADVDRVISPSPQVGGWGKFIRSVISSQKSSNRVRETRQRLEKEKQRQQLKKGGRGWLHF